MQKKKIRLNYTKLNRDLKDVAKEIEAEYPNLDYIIGLSRGGLVPTVHLSHLLCKPMDTINWSLRDHAFPGPSNFSYNVMSLLNSGANILLVDDLIDEGESLFKLFKGWEERRTLLHNIKLFTIHYNKANKFGIGPDWHLYEKKPNEWIVYPWETE